MSEYQYYEFAAIDRPLNRAEMAKLRAVSTRADITPAGFVNHYEWGDPKADPADWMRRLLPLRDELLRGNLRPLYLGWLAAAASGELRDNALEPELPPGLSAMSPAQQALVEFLEINPDMLAAAMTGSARVSEADAAQDARVDAWPEAQRPAPASSAPRHSVGQLRELARSASGVRLEREIKGRARQEAKRRQQRESTLRMLMADVDKRWAAIDAQAQRGSASGYEQAVRALAELAEGYALTPSCKEFDRALRRLMVRHATRAALMRRLTEAGLWAG